MQTRDVFSILGAAMPLSMMLMALLRCGYSLRPDSTPMLCGLFSAAAAATIGGVVRPHEAGACHLALHGRGSASSSFRTGYVAIGCLIPEKYLRRRNKGSDARMKR